MKHIKILAIDTATNSCSVALIQNEIILAENILNDGKTHSVNLMPMIKNLVNKCKLNLRNLDGFAVSIGPGTFTGLRIGLSTVKGLAYGSGKPIIGVNSLDALAFPLMNISIPIVSMIDAKRKEIYYAVYKNKNYQMKNTDFNNKILYNVASPEIAISDIPDYAILIGNGAITYSDFFKKNLKRVKIINYCNIIRASSVAFIAAKRLSIGDVDNLDALVPNYIRKSDAQIHNAS